MLTVQLTKAWIYFAQETWLWERCRDSLPLKKRGIKRLISYIKLTGNAHEKCSYLSELRSEMNQVLPCDLLSAVDAV